MTSGHDKRYKKLFSHPGFMKRLLTFFVKEEFVEDLDLSSLRRVDTSFVTEDFREKESDIIYTVKFLDQDLYIFLLLEFQSTVDKTMPIRFVRYITELYESYQGTNASGKFPAVFPNHPCTRDRARNREGHRARDKRNRPEDAPGRVKTFFYIRSDGHPRRKTIGIKKVAVSFCKSIIKRG
jgi:hypothetical protein